MTAFGQWARYALITTANVRPGPCEIVDGLVLKSGGHNFLVVGEQGCKILRIIVGSRDQKGTDDLRAHFSDRGFPRAATRRFQILAVALGRRFLADFSPRNAPRGMWQIGRSLAPSLVVSP